MTDTAIRVENLGKRYRIGQIVGYQTLREALTNAAVAPFRRLAQTVDRRRMTEAQSPSHPIARSPNHPVTNHPITQSPSPPTHIWALKDVSFEVKRGEAVGIIGRNGSGKSTLLKVLSRITAPTEGLVEVRGRVGSLLEVGTGFHAELTGRENIYLNGAVLGMKRADIKRKFDEIVEFSGVEKFIDTPVKRYSSGMSVRLAFSVAAHLEPEILLVDEVLAVGDAEFQKKCLGKMENVAGQGRTVLFVSHNMASIKTLCGRTILLDGGTVLEDGATHKVVQHYLGSGLRARAERRWDDARSAPGGEVVRLHAVRARNGKGEVTGEFNIQEPVYVEMDYWVLQDGFVLDGILRFYDESGLSLFVSYDLDRAWSNRKRPAGLYRSVCCIPGNFLNEGNLSVSAAVATLAYASTLHAVEMYAIVFHVFDPGSGGARGDHSFEWPGGVVRPLFDWKTEHLSASAR
jgi:lipopolysaccharide transport system ATP-binding protein